MLKYRIFFLGYDGKIWDAYTAQFIPENIDFDCIDDAVFHLATWIDSGSANNEFKYIFLPVYSE